MSAADLGKFSKGFAVWRQILGNAPPDDLPQLFANAAAEVAGFVAKGLDKVIAADELTDMAIGAGFDDFDLVQATIADAFKAPPGNGKAGNTKGKTEQGIIVMPKNNFVARFKPLSYLVEGMLQRGFIYALTGATSHAKSAIALALAELVSSPDRNAMFGKHRVEKGRVLYFVGENPDDIRMRVIGADSLRSDDHPENDELYFIVGQIEIGKHFDEIRDAVAAIGGVDLVTVDTSAAYFLGDEELSNTQMGTHARMLRKLTELPGNPCVLVLCHPVKHPQDWTQLLPRGGGAFLAEMDGNLTAWKHDEVMVDLNYTKMRGPGFEPMTLKLETIHTTKLDRRQRPRPANRARRARCISRGRSPGRSLGRR